MIKPQVALAPDGSPERFEFNVHRFVQANRRIEDINRAIVKLARQASEADEPPSAGDMENLLDVLAVLADTAVYLQCDLEEPLQEMFGVGKLNWTYWRDPA